MRRHNEAGATMIEAAIVSMLVFFLFFLIFQSALFMRSWLMASDTATAGARAGSVAAVDPLADYDILRGAKRAVSAASADSIEEIKVFRANNPNFAPPTSCNAASDCNVYTAEDLALVAEDFDSGTSAPDNNWPPSERAALVAGEARLGVEVTMNVPTIGGPFPDTVTRSFVIRVEPN